MNLNSWISRQNNSMKTRNSLHFRYQNFRIFLCVTKHEEKWPLATVSNSEHSFVGVWWKRLHLIIIRHGGWRVVIVNHHHQSAVLRPWWIPPFFWPQILMILFNNIWIDPLTERHSPNIQLTEIHLLKLNFLHCVLFFGNISL